MDMASGTVAARIGLLFSGYFGLRDGRTRPVIPHERRSDASSSDSKAVFFADSKNDQPDAIDILTRLKTG